MKNPIASALKTVSYIIGSLGLLGFLIALSTSEGVLGWIILLSSLLSALWFYAFGEVISLLQGILDKVGGTEGVDKSVRQAEELDDSIPSI